MPCTSVPSPSEALGVILQLAGRHVIGRDVPMTRKLDKTRASGPRDAHDPAMRAAKSLSARVLYRITVGFNCCILFCRSRERANATSTSLLQPLIGISCGISPKNRKRRRNESFRSNACRILLMADRAKLNRAQQKIRSFHHVAHSFQNSFRITERLP